jgi:hypothetical protein
VRGELRILAFITDDSIVRDILAHLGEPTAGAEARERIPPPKLDATGRGSKFGKRIRLGIACWSSARMRSATASGGKMGCFLHLAPRMLFQS